MSPEAAREELSKRADAIESGYEMMLGYAAQGLESDHGAANSSQLRDHLRRFEAALTDLAKTYRECARAIGVAGLADLEGFLETLDRDARTTQSALRFALA